MLNPLPCPFCGRVQRCRCKLVSLTVLAVCFMWIATANLYARHNGADVETHRRMDAVLYPRFTALMNEWALEHPRAEGHEQGFDLKDAKRWQAARDGWRELDAAAKAIGY